MKKKLALASSAAALLLLLAGCSKKGLTEHSSGLWNQIVYYFAVIIHWFSFNGPIAVGIILFTLVLRTLLLPLMNLQIKSSQKMQELQPQVKAIQAKYPGKDMASRQAMQAEISQLQSENGANPMMGCLPVLVQMPFLWALYQALLNVNFAQMSHFQPHFLWFDTVTKDPTYVLPILAAIFTFGSSFLMMRGNPENNGMTTAMTAIMPIFIFFIAMNLSAGVALYWVVSNAYQVFQTLIIANPWKLRAERAAKVQAEKDKEKARERALKKATKK
ncbi:MAG: YidC/Oxa1 family membrane protein insertase [Streptococcaceae bacterium]|jgi:YidC/Oxa1 family membrane protein insertase|nr:YidC/Oxa1 family membrane protein insertase [Streptococcaceae bacterium]